MRWSHRTAENQSDMMMADKEITTLGHDTTMCGDPKSWFPMRVTYSRELKVKAELDRRAGPTKDRELYPDDI